MPNELEKTMMERALSKASSIGANPISEENMLRGEVPLDPFGSGIFPGKGGAVAPVIEALKDLFHVYNNQYKVPGYYSQATRIVKEFPKINQFMGQMLKGPEKTLTKSAQILSDPANEKLLNSTIEDLFPIFFGK